MKKTYWDKWTGTLFGIILLPSYIVTMLLDVVCVYFLFNYRNLFGVPTENLEFFIGLILAPIMMTGIALFIHYSPDGDRWCALLITYDDRIKWICPGYRSVTLKYDEIEYLRVDNLDNEVSPGMTFRGDETTYIYISQHPYPGKYFGKTTRIRRKKGTIRFKYSDKLCEELTKHLPDDKCIALKAFYHKMQAHDEQERKCKEQECATVRSGIACNRGRSIVTPRDARTQQKKQSFGVTRACPLLRATCEIPYSIRNNNVTENRPLLHTIETIFAFGGR